MDANVKKKLCRQKAVLCSVVAEEGLMIMYWGKISLDLSLVITCFKSWLLIQPFPEALAVTNKPFCPWKWVKILILHFLKSFKKEKVYDSTA